MKITILTYGSRGDVQPFLALALGLQKTGHQVKLAAPHRFDRFAQTFKVPFVPLAGEPAVISRRLNDAGTNPVGMVRAMSDYIFAIADQVAREAFIACKDADLIVHSFLFTTGGHSLACKLGIPDVSVQTFPIFAPTHAFPPVSMPGVAPGPLSYFFNWLTTQIFWHAGNIGFRRLRKADPETFDLDLRWPFRTVEDRLRTPLLFAYSPTVVPRPDDWFAPHIHIPGYFFLELPNAYQPPLALSDFLAAGKPPVCVTFGSMIHRDAERIYRIVFDALGKTGNRAIVIRDWSNLLRSRAIDLLVERSPNILMMDDIPLGWLLPRCKALIHHGGAGTTGTGLRSGIPNLVVSFAADQPFWGMRIYAIGAGPHPIPVRALTVEKLIAALVEADGTAIRNGAQAAGRKIRTERGVWSTVKLIEELNAKWRKTNQSVFFKD